MRSEAPLTLLLAAFAVAGCYNSTGPEICSPAVTSWASPMYTCLAYVKEAPPRPAPPSREPARASKPPPPPPSKTEVTEEQIKLKESVEFESDSAVISDSSKGLLDEVVQVMKDHPEIEKVRVAGYTDSEGKRKLNKQLSHERAAAVKQYLIDHGIAADRVSSKGYGASRPIASNKTEAGRAENRRVEIHILRRKGETKDREPDDKKQ
jgi:outer membrane protein OmpA-like peptidoglycan-associated protein